MILCTERIHITPVARLPLYPGLGTIGDQVSQRAMEDMVAEAKKGAPLEIIVPQVDKRAVYTFQPQAIEFSSVDHIAILNYSEDDRVLVRDVPASMFSRLFPQERHEQCRRISFTVRNDSASFIYFQVAVLGIYWKDDVECRSLA